MWSWLRSGLFVLGGLAVLSLAGCGTPTPTQGVYKVGKPYQVKGVWYYPAENPRYDETGLASWYGDPFHGEKTANGEVYDQNLMTAAHKTLPMPSLVRVTNLNNGKSVVLRVNDRGPFVHGRIIDVSREAADLLGFRTQGTAPVRVTYLSRAPLDPRAPASVSNVTPKGEEMARAAPTTTVTAGSLAPPPGVSAAPSRPATSPVTAAAPQPTAPVLTPVQRPVVETVPVSGRPRIYVQAGAFSSERNAEGLRSRLRGYSPVSVAPAQIDGQRLYRVRIGPFADAAAADAMLARVLAGGIKGAQIVID